VDVNAMQMACRTRALTLVVATTGSASLAATASGFTRAAGSFLSDGFRPGMEVTATGFNAANNAARVLTNVTATLLSCAGLTAQAADTGRTVLVGLPSRHAWENVEFEPEVGQPWVEEQFTPGVTFRPGLTPHGTVEVRPLYSLHVHALQGEGIGAPNGYATGLLALFTPGSAMVLASGDVLRVRADTGVNVGQKLVRKPGYATVPVSIPLRLYTQQTIS
jgi:hypothetical protein